MSFGNEITKLKYGVSDNYTRNSDAHDDLQSKIDSLDTNLQINNTKLISEYLPKLNWERLYTPDQPYKESDIGYKNGVLQSMGQSFPNGYSVESVLYSSIRAGGGNEDLFLASFFYPKVNSYLRHNNFIFGTHPNRLWKKFPCMILNNHQFSDTTQGGGVMENIFRAGQGNHYHINDFHVGEDNYNDGKIYSEMFEDLQSLTGNSVDTNAVPTTGMQRISSSLPSVSIKFSINRTTNDTYDSLSTSFQTQGIWVGLFLLNQPIWRMQEDADLSLVYNQTDCFFSVLNLNCGRPNFNSTDPESPRDSSFFNVLNKRIYCGRINNNHLRSQTVFPGSSDYYSYFTSGTGLPITFDTNWFGKGTGFVHGCDREFTKDSLDLYSSGDHAYYNGPLLNELKLEYGHIGGDSGNDKFIINVIYNGRIVEKMISSRVAGNAFLSRGWWNQCHMIPGLILNAPEGMIKIHSFDIDMD